METKVLTELGLTEEQIKAVFAENGKDINAQKAKFTELSEKYESAKAAAESYQAKIGELEKNSSDGETYKTELDKLKKEMSDKAAADKQKQTDKDLTDKILGVMGDKKFTSDYVKSGLIADIKSEFAKDSTNGIEKIFFDITKDKEGLFQSSNPPPVMAGMASAEKKEPSGIKEALSAFYNKTE